MLTSTATLENNFQNMAKFRTFSKSKSDGQIPYFNKIDPQKNFFFSVFQVIDS